MKVQNVSKYADELRKALDHVIIAKYSAYYRADDTEIIYVEPFFKEGETVKIEIDWYGISFYKGTDLAGSMAFKLEQNKTTSFMAVARWLTHLGI